MCVNQHDPEAVEVRPDGRRVCTKCVSKYTRRRRVHGAESTSPIHREVPPNHDQRSN